MKTLITFAAGAAAMTAALAAQAAVPDIFPPRAEWTLARSAEHCRLTREFGQPGDLRLQMDSFGGTTDFGFIISGKRVPYHRSPNTSIRVAYSTDTEARPKTDAMRGKMGDVPAISFRAGFLPTPAQLDPALWGAGEKTNIQRAEMRSIILRSADRVQNIALEFADGSAVQLDTGSMAEPMAKMRACADDLVASWGMDPAAYRSQLRAPRPLPATMEKMQAAAGRGKVRGGTAIFLPIRIMVDATGRVTHCAMQAPIASEAVEQLICSAAMGGYEPALDASGQPAASVHLLTVHWGAR